MTNSIVSVVLCTYNGEKFLQMQLNSIAAQTMLPLELIIADDGSTDDTHNIIKRFSDSAPFPCIILENIGRLGAVKNFLRAIRQAKGELIAFCDQDDLWNEKKLEVCTLAFQESDILLLGHSVDLMNENSIKIGRWRQGIKFSGQRYIKLNPWQNFLGMSIVFHRRLCEIADTDESTILLNPHNGLPGVSHDQWFDLVADSLAKNQALELPLATYRLHSSNLSGVNVKLARRIVQLKVDAGFAIDPSRKLPAAALQRAELIERSAAKAKGNIALELSKSANKWRALSELEQRRELMHLEKGFFNRILILISLIFSGSYRNWSKGGIGHLVLFKDLLIAIHPRKFGKF